MVLHVHFGLCIVVVVVEQPHCSFHVVVVALQPVLTAPATWPVVPVPYEFSHTWCAGVAAPVAPALEMPAIAKPNANTPEIINPMPTTRCRLHPSAASAISAHVRLPTLFLLRGGLA